jgi:cobalt/nickel transport system permease protein
MAGQLFLRSWERSDRVYNAMLARGYAGHLYTLNAHVMEREDWWFFAGAMAMLVLIQIIGRIA